MKEINIDGKKVKPFLSAEEADELQFADMETVAKMAFGYKKRR